MNKYFCILISLFIFCYSYATIINIPADQPTIQAGINVAVDGDTILVQPDTYVENIDYIGKNITVASLFLTTQDTTYISQTIIDGNQNGPVVTFTSGEDSTAVLTGFTIQNGFGYAGWSNFGGGGIFLHNTNPKLINLIISNNNAIGNGGGIYGPESSPSLVNVTLINNYACNGGGIFLNNSDSTLENITITSNSALNHGGGIDFYTCSPSMQNVIIADNSADLGGGIHCWQSDPNLINVIIEDNSADLGGGIYFELYCLPNLVNVIIADNSATSGGGIYSWASDPNLVNVTISGNTASTGGAIYFQSGCQTLLINSILWNDSPEEVYFDENYSPNSITISYSDIQGGEAGIVTINSTVYWLEGNIDEDPLFVGTGGYPYSLLEDSSCIDAGNPDPIYYDPEDPNNPCHALYPAMGFFINDMGAYGGPNVIGWPVLGLDDNVFVQTPEVLSLQNYPNPFNPSTTISFSTTEHTEHTEIIIYNIKGQKIRTFQIPQSSISNPNSVVWNGKDERGNAVSSGIYLYRLEAGNYSSTKKMLLMK